MGDNENSGKKHKKKKGRKKNAQNVTVDDVEDGSAAPEPEVKKKRRRKSQATIEESDDVPGPKEAPKKPTKSFDKKEVESCVDSFVEYCSKQGVDGFRKIYREKLGNFLAPGPCSAWEANKLRNRYADIVCLEETRVKLVLDVPPATDYIHANWVKFEGHDRVFIATQAPMENTNEDFWRMIFQEQSPIIVNLTKCLEDGKVKCSQYWPDAPKKVMVFGKYTVNCKKVDETEFPVYTIEILPEGCSNSLIVKLIHMTSWPDRGIPMSDRAVLRLIKLISEADCLATGPITVHCSAGVGRTGSMILIDVFIRRIFSAKHVDGDLIESFFKTLRSSRASAIQKEGQFLFVISSVLEYIAAKNKRHAEKAAHFRQEYRTSNLPT